MRISRQNLKPSLHRPSGTIAKPALRLPVWQRRSFHGVCALLTGSGILWLAAHFFLRPVGEFGVGISPLEPWSMKLHGAAAMLVLWLVGTMLHLHIRRGLAAGRNRSAGWSMIILLGFLATTGYALYYIAGEESRPVWSVLHWAAGLLLPAMVWLHIFFGKKSARQ